MQVAFMKQVVEGLNFAFDGTHVAFVNYANESNVRFYLNSEYTEKRDILNAIGITEIGHETRIAAGLRTIRDKVYTTQNGDRDGTPNVCILLSDGRATKEADRTIEEARLTRGRGITIISVGIGDWTDIYTLGQIASSPESRNRYWIKTRSEVESEANKVLDRLCN